MKLLVKAKISKSDPKRIEKFLSDHEGEITCGQLIDYLSSGTMSSEVGGTTRSDAYQLKASSSSRSVELGKPWECECGKSHELGGYVAAHWNDKLIHTCECGRKHIIENGTLSLEENL